MLLDVTELRKNLSRQIDKQKADIFSYIFRNEPAARKDITQNLGLRSTTVSNIVQELVDDGLVVEGKSLTQGRPGRPDIGLHSVPERLVAATIYVEDHQFIGSLVDIAGNILAKITIAVQPQEANLGVIRQYRKILKHLKDAVPAGSEFLGVGISAVGTIDGKNNIWVNADRWPKIQDLDIGQLGKENGVPIVLRRNLDNELAYMLEKNPQWRNENTILFHWGFGIGGAYAYQGTILDSSAGRYMDIGHITVNTKSKRRCRCGLYGCLEAEAAIFGLLPLLRRYFPGLREDSDDIDRVLGDPKIFRIPAINHAIDTVGLALSNLFKIFYPHRIFLVGPFSKNTEVVNRLETIILKTFYKKMRDQVHTVNLIVIPDGFIGCTWANGYSFFRKRLREMLTIKS
jgi:transcriptional regulator of PTS gene